MSNHFSAAYLKFPGDDARLDLTDLFVFTSSASAGRTVLIIDFNTRHPADEVTNYLA